MSMEDLAKALGANRQYVYELERGKKYPSRLMIQHIAEVLNAPELEEQFFTREDVREVRALPNLVTAVKRLMRRMIG